LRGAFLSLGLFRLSRSPCAPWVALHGVASRDHSRG